jgi:hypothetical protein
MASLAWPIKPRVGHAVKPPKVFIIVIHYAMLSVPRNEQGASFLDVMLCAIAGHGGSNIKYVVDLRLVMTV